MFTVSEKAQEMIKQVIEAKEGNPSVRLIYSAGG